MKKYFLLVVASFLCCISMPSLSESAKRTVKADDELSAFYVEFLKSKTGELQENERQKFIERYLFELSQCLVLREIQTDYLEFETRRQYSDEKQIQEVLTEIVIPKNRYRKEFYAEHIKQFISALRILSPSLDPQEYEKGLMSFTHKLVKSNVSKWYSEYKETNKYPEGLRRSENKCSRTRLAVSDLRS